MPAIQAQMPHSIESTRLTKPNLLYKDLELTPQKENGTCLN